MLPSPRWLTRLGVLALLGVVVHVDAANGDCASDPRCVHHCGSRCRARCELEELDAETLAQVQACLSETAAESCAATPSVECFTGCQFECQKEIDTEVEADGAELGEADDEPATTVDPCREECNLVCQHLLTPARTETEDGVIQDDFSEPPYTELDVDACLKLCTVAECLAVDERFAFDVSSSEVTVVHDPTLTVDGANDWEKHGSDERQRLLAAFEDPTSPEATQYSELMDFVSSQFGNGEMDELSMEMMELIEEMGREGASEDEILALVQSLMGSMEMDGYGYGAMGDEYDYEFEDEFSEEPDPAAA